MKNIVIYKDLNLEEKIMLQRKIAEDIRRQEIAKIKPAKQQRIVQRTMKIDKYGLYLTSFLIGVLVTRVIFLGLS